LNRLLKVNKSEDIPEIYQNTPISELLEYHNLGKEFKEYSNAQLLIGMCMDNRKKLRIPENFAYVIRTGGGNLRYSEFKVSFAIAVGDVNYIALIGHNHCNMVNIFSKKDKFISGLVERAGWDPERAEEHFVNFAPMFEIDNEIDFTLNEARRIRIKYPKIHIVPLHYLVEDNKIYLIQE